MAKKSRRKRARFYTVVVGVLLIGCAVSIHHEYYLRAVWLGSFAVVTACLIAAVLFPVRCSVATRQGLPCRNAANGVLFGCSQAGHTWIKFRAHFGRPERVAVRTSATTARAADVAEPGRANVLFWLALIATASGFISMTTDVIGLFD